VAFLGSAEIGYECEVTDSKTYPNGVCSEASNELIAPLVYDEAVNNIAITNESVNAKIEVMRTADSDAKLLTTTKDGYRSLRGAGTQAQRELSCWFYCRYIPRGQCWLVYPQCWGWRRLEDELKQDKISQETMLQEQKDRKLQDAFQCEVTGEMNEKIHRAMVKMAPYIRDRGDSACGQAMETDLVCRCFVE
jgi:hypothetical protein